MDKLQKQVICSTNYIPKILFITLLNRYVSTQRHFNRYNEKVRNVKHEIVHDYMFSVSMYKNGGVFSFVLKKRFRAVIIFKWWQLQLKLNFSIDFNVHLKNKSQFGAVISDTASQRRKNGYNVSHIPWSVGHYMWGSNENLESEKSCEYIENMHICTNALGHMSANCLTNWINL